MQKIIYEPKEGSAAWEYSKYAVSLYEGCVGEEKHCTYCYMASMAHRFKRYFGVARLKEWLVGKDVPAIFEMELKKKLPEYQKHGMFFFFNSDPCLPQTIELSAELWKICANYDVPIIILTKQTWWVDAWLRQPTGIVNHTIAIGFTLTGMDEQELGCPPNAERIKALKKLHGAGYKVWISAEPTISFINTKNLIVNSLSYCNHIKLGLQSGKYQDTNDAYEFMDEVIDLIAQKNNKSPISDQTTIYFKKSIRDCANYNPSYYPFILNENISSIF